MSRCMCHPPLARLSFGEGSQRVIVCTSSSMNRCRMPFDPNTSSGVEKSAQFVTTPSTSHIAWLAATLIVMVAFTTSSSPPPTPNSSPCRVWVTRGTVVFRSHSQSYSGSLLPSNSNACWRSRSSTTWITIPRSLGTAPLPTVPKSTPSNPTLMAGFPSADHVSCLFACPVGKTTTG
jgi:hypothetical protein